MFAGSSYNMENKICNHYQPILFNNIPVPRATNYKCLGVILDQKLGWDNDIEMICKKVFAGIAVIRRVKLCVPPETLHASYI
jgi:hypothetical protein